MGISASTHLDKVHSRFLETKEVLTRVMPKGVSRGDSPIEREGRTICEVGPVLAPRRMGLQLIRVAGVVARGCEQNGGLLVHGALVEKECMGVILAGPGGVGKSTAARRLPSSWRVLSDDMCLIVRSPQGEYWAHPWPTLSRIRLGDLGGTWDVGKAVPLRMICMLAQHEADQLELLSRNQAVSELVDVSGQTRVFMTGEMDESVARRVNLQRFHNTVAMARKLPIYRLHISLTGKFWERIEELLSANSPCGDKG